VPFVEQLQPLRLPYVLVAKPDSQPTLLATVAAAEAHGVSQPGQWEEAAIPGQGLGGRRRDDQGYRRRHARPKGEQPTANSPPTASL